MIMEIFSVAVFLAFYLYAGEIPKVYRYSCYYWLPVAMVTVSFSLQKGFISRALSNRLLVTGGGENKLQLLHAASFRASVIRPMAADI